MSENLVESLHNENMLYFILGSIISSDSIFSKKDAEESINALSVIEKALIDSALEDSEKSKYKELIKRCYEVLESDMKRFE